MVEGSEWNDLQRDAFVALPLLQAPEYIERFFARSSKVADRVRLAIRSQVHLPLLDTHIELRHEVIVTLSISREAGRAGVAEYVVGWEPADGGAFPRLRGNLRAQSAGDPGALLLVLDGSYATSAGGAAHSCETATGHRIAQATARDLLSYVGRSLERSYREREN